MNTKICKKCGVSKPLTEFGIKRAKCSACKDLPYDSMQHPNFLKSWALENLRPYNSKQNLLDGIKRVRHNKMDTSLENVQGGSCVGYDECGSSAGGLCSKNGENMQILREKW